MYTMKEACKMTNMRYETLKFYCNQGLVPNVKRDENNRRIFDDRDIAWINSLSCLKNCELSLAEMRQYIELCKAGEESILERKEFLTRKQKELFRKLEEVNEAIDYIDRKQRFYDDVLSGKIPYFSNLTDAKQK